MILVKSQPVREISFADLSFPGVKMQNPLLRIGFFVYTSPFESYAFNASV
jgi:hypothetical protein